MFLMMVILNYSVKTNFVNITISGTEFNQLNSGESLVIEDAFEVYISNNAPDLHSSLFTVTINSNGTLF